MTVKVQDISDFAKVHKTLKSPLVRRFFIPRHRGPVETESRVPTDEGVYTRKKGVAKLYQNCEWGQGCPFRVSVVDKTSIFSEMIR